MKTQKLLFDNLETIDEAQARAEIMKETRTAEALFDLLITKAENKKGDKEPV